MTTTTYRVTATLSQRQLIDYLDANGEVDVKIEVVPEGSSEATAPISNPFVPRVQRRKRRTKAEMEAARAAA